MPFNRFAVRKCTNATWTVVDVLSARPARTRDRVLICMPREEAVDAVEMLNMIEHWKHQPLDVVA